MHVLRSREHALRDVARRLVRAETEPGHHGQQRGALSKGERGDGGAGRCRVSGRQAGEIGVDAPAPHPATLGRGADVGAVAGLGPVRA